MILKGLDGVREWPLKANPKDITGCWIKAALILGLWFIGHGMFSVEVEKFHAKVPEDSLKGHSETGDETERNWYSVTGWLRLSVWKDRPPWLG
jgi:hypothetical protein